MRRNDGMPGYQPLSGRAREAEREAEVQREVAAAKAAAQARPSPVPAAPEPEPPAAIPALKGIVKVDAFPELCKYPFQEMADDGGIWKVDPSAYGAKAVSIRTSASKWAIDHGLKARTRIDGETVYVQFTKATP